MSHCGRFSFFLRPRFGARPTPCQAARRFERAGLCTHIIVFKATSLLAAQGCHKIFLIRCILEIASLQVARRGCAPAFISRLGSGAITRPQRAPAQLFNKPSMLTQLGASRKRTQGLRPACQPPDRRKFSRFLMDRKGKGRLPSPLQLHIDFRQNLGIDQRSMFDPPTAVDAVSGAKRIKRIGRAWMFAPGQRQRIDDATTIHRRKTNTRQLRIDEF